METEWWIGAHSRPLSLLRSAVRFLKKDEKLGKWYDIGDKRAAEKTSQALREKTNEERDRASITPPFTSPTVYLPTTTTAPPQTTVAQIPVAAAATGVTAPPPTPATSASGAAPATKVKTEGSENGHKTTKDAKKDTKADEGKKDVQNEKAGSGAETKTTAKKTETSKAAKKGELSDETKQQSMEGLVEV